MNNALNWFELPTHDLERATAFYERALGITMKREPFAGTIHSVFPFEAGVGGALVHDPAREPSTAGALVYLNVNGKMDAVLAGVAAAGGQVLQPKTDVGPVGYIALVRDPEGNVVGLHAIK